MNTRRAGYSLFEVLLAFAIMAMILSVLLPRQADLLGRVDAIEERALALDYAQSRLAMLGIVVPLLQGSRVETYRNWQVSEQIYPTPITGTELSGLLVIISISDQSNRLLAELTTVMIPNEQS